MELEPAKVDSGIHIKASTCPLALAHTKSRVALHLFIKLGGGGRKERELIYKEGLLKVLVGDFYSTMKRSNEKKNSHVFAKTKIKLCLNKLRILFP